jgi:hypothetical protein
MISTLRLSVTLLGSLSLWVTLTAAPAMASAPAFPQEWSEQEIAQMKRSTRFILTLSDEELRKRIPVESGGIWFTDCPNCEFGSQDRGRFTWRPEKPSEIECQGCGETYPGNEKYPDDQYLEVDSPDGTHRFHYWENEEGYRIFFRAHADYLHRGYLEQTARDLGRLFAATGDDRFARPAAIILQRFAEVVPGYAYIFDFPYRQKQFSPYTHNRLPVPAYRTSLWTRWAYNDIPQPLLEAYETLQDWEGWEPLGGAEARRTIEEDLFTLIIDFVMGFEDPLTNMSPRIWQDAIYAGRIMKRPEWVHESIARFERMLNTQFMHDGHWYETSPSYHAMTIAGMRRVMQAAQGYSDPDGYQHPDTGRRFENLDLRRDVPQYGLAIRALEETRLPTGRLLPVNDTWAVHGRTAREQRSPREASESLFMPGLGVAILGTGEKDRQLFSWLNFTSGTAHKQRDTLSLGLFARDRELLPDIGYTHTRYRRSWASSMMAHNTVVVNGRESRFDADHSGNRLVAFASDRGGFHLAAAESIAAYSEETERYRRTLILLGENSEDGYLLDIFEVSGGHQHDYILHGSADEDSTATLAGATLTPFDGSLANPEAQFAEPVGEHDELGVDGAFFFIRDLQRAPMEGALQLDLRLVDAPEVGTRTLFAALDNTELYLGQSPSLRRAAESDARINDAHMPSLVLRRKGEALSTVFVAAHEPVHGAAKLKELSIHRGEDRLWVSIAHESGKDLVSVSLNEPAEASWLTREGTFTTDARYAAVRLDSDGTPYALHLVEGLQVGFGEAKLAGSGRMEGTIREIISGKAGSTAFVVNEALAPNQSQALLIDFADRSRRAYSVTRVAPFPGGSRIHVQEAAGFQIEGDSVELTSFPQRTIQGSSLRYRLIDSSHAAR